MKLKNIKAMDEAIWQQGTVFKGRVFKLSDKKMNISDVMCGCSKKSNFVENTVKLAKEIGYELRQN